MQRLFTRRRKVLLGVAVGLGLLVVAFFGLTTAADIQAAPAAQATAAAGGTAAPMGTAGGTATAVMSAQLSIGRVTFTQSGCASCHGALGQGGIGPQLAGRNLPLPYVLFQLRTPRGVMPPYPPQVLTDTQVAAIAAYIDSLPAPMGTVTATATTTNTFQRLNQALLALDYLQSPDMQKYLTGTDLQSAIQELRQALQAVQQALSTRSTPVPGTPTPGITSGAQGTAVPMQQAAPMTPTTGTTPGAGSATPSGTPTP
jgi:mono/diheme cytochrome c family protein